MVKPAVGFVKIQRFQDLRYILPNLEFKKLIRRKQNIYISIRHVRGTWINQAVVMNIVKYTKYAPV